MKIIILSITLLCLANLLNAQNNYVPICNNLISAPKVPLVSTVTIDYTHIYDNKEHVIYNFEYEWTQNNTNVNFEDQWNEYSAVLNTNGDVIYYEGKSKTYPYPYECQDTYEYDSQHRVIKKESSGNSRTLAYYTNTDTDSIVTFLYDDYLGKWLKTGKEDVKYFDSYVDRELYRFNNETKNYEYRFTNRNYINSEYRIIKSIDIDSSAGSVYEYTYEKNGYIEFITYFGNDHASFKKEYLFNERGDITSYHYYEWFNGSYWKPCIMIEYSYNYIATSIENIEIEEKFTIHGHKILFKEDTEVSICTLNGVILFQGIVAQGQFISLPSKQQLYILKIGDRVHKVVL